jgi:hypothetical protein
VDIVFLTELGDVLVEGHQLAPKMSLPSGEMCATAFSKSGVASVSKRASRSRST